MPKYIQTEHWKNFSYFAGVESISKSVMDECHTTCVIKPPKRFKIWLKTHSGAKKLSYAEFLEQANIHWDAHKWINYWITAYKMGDKWYEEEVDVYQFEDSPYAIHVRDGGFCVLLAPLITLGEHQNE